MNGNLARFYASVLKDARIIARDRQALVLFFVMPVLFVLILSLALRDAFGERPGATFPVLLIAPPGDLVGDSVEASLRANHHIRLTRMPRAATDAVRAWLVAGRYKFAILIPEGAGAQARRRVGEIMAQVPPELRIERAVEVRTLTDPALRADYRKVLEGLLALALHAVEMRLGREQLEQTLRLMRGKDYVPLPELDQARLFSLPPPEPVTKRTLGPVPTSVQQNAPAWTLLAMFFLTVPLSVSFIKERDQGSLFRLQTMTVPAWVVLGGKALPYFVINLMQMGLILLASRYVLPWLGGDALELGQAPLALLITGAAASLAAIGFGIAVAVYARTSEQATVFSSSTVMILAALGGILVPKTLMPPLMQQLAQLSPLSWGLDAFQDVFVRGGGVRDVMPEVLGLLAFSAVCHGIAILRY
ncbi:MAG: ABC transporter permease, partial [Thiobacillaceae bacterium]|nr:ABC transporter permease [Thiobacillaceae bacterium]MDW8323089.1 ABC transporter permease [Burkholderiales bacterium]